MRRPTRPTPVDIAARLTPGQWCYWLPEDQDQRVHGGFVPSVVVRGEHEEMAREYGRLSGVFK